MKDLLRVTSFGPSLPTSCHLPLSSLPVNPLTYLSRPQDTTVVHTCNCPTSFTIILRSKTLLYFEIELVNVTQYRSVYFAKILLNKFPHKSTIGEVVYRVNQGAYEVLHIFIRGSNDKSLLLSGCYVRETILGRLLRLKGSTQGH